MPACELYAIGNNIESGNRLDPSATGHGCICATEGQTGQTCVFSFVVELSICGSVRKFCSVLQELHCNAACRSVAAVEQASHDTCMRTEAVRPPVPLWESPCQSSLFTGFPPAADATRGVHPDRVPEISGIVLANPSGRLRRALQAIHRGHSRWAVQWLTGTSRSVIAMTNSCAATGQWATKVNSLPSLDKLKAA